MCTCVCLQVSGAYLCMAVFAEGNRESLLEYENSFSMTVKEAAQG